jgi:hypothetical protein
MISAESDVRARPRINSADQRPVELSFLDEKTKAELNSLAKAGPPAVLLLKAEQHDLVIAVASTLGKVWVVDPVAREHDLIFAVPEGRWDVEQLRSLVMRPLQTIPLQHRLMIVDRVDELDDTSVDLLLKVLEEPGEATSFILLTSDASELKSTLRGRVERSVLLNAATPSERVKMLVTGGAQEQDAKLAVEVSADLVSLASFLVGEPALLASAVRLRALTDRMLNAPASAASSAVAEFDLLAAAYGKGFGSGERGVRAARRALVESWIGQLRESAVATLSSGTSPDRVAFVLTACDLASERLRTHAPLAISLTALHVAVAELHRN